MATRPTISIVYFGVRARAESIRMMLKHAGIPYTDLSPQEHYGASWKEIKASPEKGPTFGQLPVLLVDGKELCQSGSINRYVASITGHMPTDAFEAAIADSVFEASQDLSVINPLTNVKRGDDFANAKSTFFESTLPPRLKALSNMLGDKDFFCGEKAMYCDFGLYHRFDLCRLVHPPSLDNYDNIIKWMRRVESIPGVEEYLKTRPDCVDIGTQPNLKPTADPSSIQTENRIFN